MNTTKRKHPTKRSRYADKAPHRYSADYREWHLAAKRGDDRAMQEADRNWRRHIARLIRALHPSDFAPMREAAE